MNPHLLMENKDIVQPASVQIRAMWQLGYYHVPAGLEYPSGGWPEMDRDPENLSEGIP